MQQKNILLAEHLRALRTVYGLQRPDWHPDQQCLVRIVIDSPLRDNARTSSSLRGFERRTGLIGVGAALRTVRLYRTSLDGLNEAAKTLSQSPGSKSGSGFIEKYVELLPCADISHRVTQESLINESLDICYHNIGEHAWQGIAKMLVVLGGTNIKEHRGIQTLGYGTVLINHAKATIIAQHPLVRRVDVVSRITFR
jgi:hypothetical protein